MSLSPMMQQYHDAKSSCGDALLLFRMGDFYELFYEDAKTAAKLLNLSLTSREKGENAVPMAGFPYHQLEAYLGRLIAAGQRVAICEQVEDPRQAKGIVQREVTRIVTAGTLTDDALLDPKTNNYLAAVVPGDQVGLAWVELSTGRFLAQRVSADRLGDELARIGPVEVLIDENSPQSLPGVNGQTLITKRPVWVFSHQAASEALAKHFGTASLEGFGFNDDDVPAIRAAGAVLDYLVETQKVSLAHIDRLLPHRPGGTLEIDESSRRSLEISRTLREGRREGTLLSVLDRTTTAMGSRMLADWVANPLAQREPIVRRQEAIGEILSDDALLPAVREALNKVYDVERLLARVTTGRATPRDLCFLGRTLAVLPAIQETLSGCKSRLLCQIRDAIDTCPELAAQLSAALVDDCPLSSRDGGFIRDGFHAELDSLRELAAGGKQWIASYQAKEAAESGIPSLKVGFNQVFGYYIEVTNAHRDKVPPHYIRKQTIKNAERYITPELKEYEEQVLSADERSKTLECELFLKLRDEVSEATQRLRTTAQQLATLDILASLAELARLRGYCCPEIVEAPVLQIVAGRHPVLDAADRDGSFVPNDVAAGPDAGLILLITGPNMAGKSTYIRQVALITLMAQLGSYVPAKSARIGITDRIFARVGASDELSRGQSTFMVEMTEAARILNTATPRSLVILDEVGRGTSTYDGLSLAWAIVEYLHDSVGCRTLFATHYHELTDLGGQLPSVHNLNVAVREWQDDVVFLHKIVDGAADKSYGIHVARLAGVPREVLERARQILARLEEEHLDECGKPKLAARKQKRSGGAQLALFSVPEDPVIEEIRTLNLNETTPIAALQLIQRWQQDLATRR